MHNLLDDYMREFEAELQSLPLDQRKSDVAETRQHLEAMAAAYRELGHSDSEAIALAIDRFGKSKLVARNMVRATSRSGTATPGRVIGLAAWCMFLVSMVMPSTRVFGATLRGYHCALIVMMPNPLPGTLAGVLYYHSIAAANLIMLLAPLMFGLSKSLSTTRRIALLVFLAMCTVLPLASPDQWMIGFYVWLASFVIAAAGAVMRCGYTRRAPKPVRG